MDIYFKHKFYRDFINQRNIAIKSCVSLEGIENMREISPWDKVGVESGLPHTVETTYFLDERLGEGNWDIINKSRHFNMCFDNPYNFAHIHYDDYDYILIIYLNLPTQYGTLDGTNIVSNKSSGVNYVNDRVKDDINPYYELFEQGGTLEDTLKQETVIMDSEYMQPDKWDVDIFVPMKSNKGFMFECRHLHAESRNFGNCALSSRLVEVVYINKK